VQLTVQVDNIKCGGCANSISNKLLALEGIEQVDVNVEAGSVSIQAVDAYDQQLVLDTLLSMGYPQVGTVAGLSSVGAKAKSFVSCAVGRMSDDTP